MYSFEKKQEIKIFLKVIWCQSHIYLFYLFIYLFLQAIIWFQVSNGNNHSSIIIASNNTIQNL